MTRIPLIIDFRTPAAGLATPLELWLACHQRVLLMARMVERLRDHLAANSIDEAARTTATSIRRYFDEAAPRHHQDEELDLFPCLRAALKGRGARRLAGTMTRLSSDHRMLDGIWSQLRMALVQIEVGAPAILDGPVVTDFVARYTGHCEIENEMIAPALATALTAQQTALIAQSMSRRRAVDWDVLAAARH